MWNTPPRASNIGGTDLSAAETKLIETVLQMESGYVLDFSDRTIAEFFQRFDMDIHSTKYQEFGTSKAKKLRSLFRQTRSPLAGQILEELLQHRLNTSSIPLEPSQVHDFRAIASRFGAALSAETEPKKAKTKPKKAKTKPKKAKTAPLQPPVGNKTSPLTAHSNLISEASRPSKHKHDVTVSFAGEDRSIAEAVAIECKRLGISVFYDQWEQSRLWGMDLYQELAEVYSNQAQYCVIFISEAYARKLWTKHEYRFAQERAFRESEAYILPVRLDATVLPGMPQTVGYLEYPHHNAAEIAQLLHKKLGR